MTIYRLTKAKHQEEVFTGTGSMRTDGRWHRAGTPIIYASGTAASALLEVIAHAEAPSLLSHPYVLFTIDVNPDRHLLALPRERWPSDWRARQWPASTQHIGIRWFQDRDSAILEVPSAIVSRQRNYLINPQHPHFQELQIDGPGPFEIDPRLA